MKSALVYLLLTKLKNQIKSILKSPSKLIYGIFFIALIVFCAMPNSDSATIPNEQSTSMLTALLTIFYTTMFAIVFINGSSNKKPMFSLSDVTILFSSPLSSNKILIYGLVNQMGTSFILGFFLLFQYSWMNTVFGITYADILLILLGYAITLFMAQVCSMAVYTRTSGKSNAPKAIKLATVAVLTLYVAAALFSSRNEIAEIFSGGKNYLSPVFALCDFLSTLPGLLFPVSGWCAGLIGGVFIGNAVQSFVMLMLIVALAAVLIFFISAAESDYYEDVMQTAETAHSAITAAKEGIITETTPKKVKVGKTGLKNGFGASAIYSKHKVENRRSGILVFSPLSLFFAIFTVFFAFILSQNSPLTSLISVFAMGTYFQLFTTTLGRFNRELGKPYIYLIPEPPIKKLLYAIKETFVADCIEAVIIFGIIAIVTRCDPLTAVFCILARISFALLFTAGNILVERVFGVVSSKALIFIFYFLTLLIMAIPGIVLGIVLLVLEILPSFIPLFFGMMFANTVIALLVMYLCRNLLQYAELNSK